MTLDTLLEATLRSHIDLPRRPRSAAARIMDVQRNVQIGFNFLHVPGSKKKAAKKRRARRKCGLEGRCTRRLQGTQLAAQMASCVPVMAAC